MTKKPSKKKEPKAKEQTIRKPALRSTVKPDSIVEIEAEPQKQVPAKRRAPSKPADAKPVASKPVDAKQAATKSIEVQETKQPKAQKEKKKNSPEPKQNDVAEQKEQSEQKKMSKNSKQTKSDIEKKEEKPKKKSKDQKKNSEKQQLANIDKSVIVDPVSIDKEPPTNVHESSTDKLPSVKLRLKLSSPGQTPSPSPPPSSPLLKKIKLRAVLPSIETPKPKKKSAASLLQDIPKLNRAVQERLKKQTDTDGRDRTEIFQQLPSKKLYPDYYLFILDPECLRGIREKVSQNLITTSQALLERYRVMFKNAMDYNDPSSIVHADAIHLLTSLEKFFGELYAEPVQLSPEPKSKPVTEKIKKPKAVPSILPPVSIVSDEMTLLYDAIETNQQDLFLHRYNALLSSRGVKSIDVNTCNASSHNSSWSLVHCASYFGATKILEYLLDVLGGNSELPDPIHQGTALAWAAFGGSVTNCKLLITRYHASTTVRNAQGLTPLGLALDALVNPSHQQTSQWKRVLSVSLDHNNPELRHRLQLVIGEITSLRDGKRKIADPFLGLSSKEEYPDYYNIIKNPICLHQILDMILHRDFYSLGDFVADIELLVSNAMTYNDPESWIAKDARTIKETCIYWLGNKEYEEARAHGRKYTDPPVLGSWSGQVPQAPQDTWQARTSNLSNIRKHGIAPHRQLDEYVHTDGTIFVPGDTVILSPAGPSDKPVICQVSKFWKDRRGSIFLSGHWYLYPEQTIHLPTRKFFEMEVFRTKTLRDHPVTDIIRKCMVLPPSEYRRGCPEGFSASDVYVCEFKYSEMARQIDRIRDWFKVTRIDLSKIKLHPWAVPRPAQRTVSSVFYDPGSDPVKAFKETYEDNTGSWNYYPVSVGAGGYQVRPRVTPVDERRVKFQCRVERFILRSESELGGDLLDNDEEEKENIKMSLVLEPDADEYICHAMAAPDGMEQIFLFMDKGWRLDPQNIEYALQQAGESERGSGSGWLFTEMVFHNVSKRVNPLTTWATETAALDKWACYPVLLQKGLNVIELFTVYQPPSHANRQVVIDGEKNVQLGMRLFITKGTV